MNIFFRLFNIILICSLCDFNDKNIILYTINQVYYLTRTKLIDVGNYF